MATPGPDGLPLPDDFRFEGPWTVIFSAPSDIAREVYLATPTCKKGPCDATATIQDFAARPLGRTTFTRDDGRYIAHLETEDTIACTTPAGETVQDAQRHVVTELVVATIRPAGTAVERVLISGTRVVTVTPPNGSECLPEVTRYLARGEPTEWAASAPTPRPTARATPRSTTRPNTGGSGGGSSYSYSTALKYSDHVILTYNDRIRAALWNAGAKLFGATCNDAGSGGARAECLDAEMLSISKPLQRAVRLHIAFMDDHKASRCFADAYDADRRVMSAYSRAAKALNPARSTYGDAQAAAMADWDKWLTTAQSRQKTFTRKWESYFSNCS